MRQVKKVDVCRVCGNDKLDVVFDMGELKINAFTAEPNTDVGSAPLTLVHCNNCDLIQLDHTVREEDLYTNYWYLSRLNKKIVDNLESIANDVVEYTGAGAGDIAVDIGANDGTLSSFLPDDLVTVGVDPAQNIHSELEQNVDIMIGDFFTAENYRKYVGERQAKIVTSVAMF